MNIAYLNNKFVPVNRAKVSILDRGFLYGDGAFETMRAYKGAVFRLEKHIDRLFKSLEKLHIHSKINKLKMKKIIYKLLDKNRLQDAYIKIIVSRGKSSGLLIPSGRLQSTLVIYAAPYKRLAKRIYKNGIKVLISKSKYNESSKIAGNKTLNYLDNVLCRYEAKNKNFDDAVLVNTKGFVSEATSSNIFMVTKGKLYTPSLESGTLPGITRGEVIRLAKKILRARVREGFIKIDGLYDADEVFLTNSLAGIVPVARIGSHAVGSGSPGPVTKRLMGAFRDAVEK